MASPSKFWDQGLKLVKQKTSFFVTRLQSGCCGPPAIQGLERQPAVGTVRLRSVGPGVIKSWPPSNAALAPLMMSASEVNGLPRLIPTALLC